MSLTHRPGTPVQQQLPPSSRRSRRPSPWTPGNQSWSAGRPTPGAETPGGVNGLRRHDQQQLGKCRRPSDCRDQRPPRQQCGGQQDVRVQAVGSRRQGKPGQQRRTHRARLRESRGLRVGNTTHGAIRAHGSATRPTNSTVPVGRSRTRKMNGRSTRTSTGLGFADSVCITTPVAAAASVPASSTDTKVL